MKSSNSHGRFNVGIMIIMMAVQLASCKKANVNTTPVVTSVTPAQIDTLVNTLDQDTIFERGGSNYGFYSMGSYLDSPTQDNWYKYLNLRPVIGSYHLAPDTVRNQLAVMFANGQRRLALDLWYSDGMPEAGFQDSGFCSHEVNSRYGVLFAQQQANLKALLHDIDHQGFEVIVFRFATEGDSDPLHWSTWQEDKYNSNWSFISSTIYLIQNEIASLQVKVIYDLGLELGGADIGMSLSYSKRLWSDYIKIFGSHNTMGFSYATAPQRFTQSIAVYDQVGVRPDVYGFDVYGDEFNTYSYLKTEMDAVGETSKPIIANEVYYNDPITYSQLLEVRAQLNLNIKFLLEWPLSRNRPGYFSADFPGDFSAYDH
jgi:hypothetical protein